MANQFFRFLLLVFSTVSSHTTVAFIWNDDRIVNLPGLTFKPNFEQYSGFLPTKTGNFLHYWLIESQNNPSTDPLVLWFNGGLGCNSLDGPLAQIGPFRVNQDGESLFENIYSWNKVANLIFLESPYGIGYSYRNTSIPSDVIWDDDMIAEDNADALEQFFQRFKQYQNRDFYITGQAYTAIHGPMLANVLIKRIQQNGNLYNIKLAGLAIGNGAYNEMDRINSMIALQYYNGMLDKKEFESFTNCCLTAIPGPLAYCNFSQFINWTTNKPIDNSECASKITKYAFNKRLENSFNKYQDCYMDPISTDDIKIMKSMNYQQQPMFNVNSPETFIDQGSLINIESTDAQYGFPCWIKNAIKNYLNLSTVREALNIPNNLPSWSMCSKMFQSNYKRKYLDMMPIFQSIIHHFPLIYPNDIRILIYNGDADIQYNFLSNEWFVMRITNNYPKSNRQLWTYQENSEFLEQLAGYYQQFFMSDYVTIDYVTVKGAGHFVPLDRGGPSLQMFANFIEKANYSSILSYDTKPKSILPQYQPVPQITPTRKQRDRIWNLPGLTFEQNFKQYSGYLKADSGHLHYWFVESQRNSSNDPLILWLSGEPSCSSLNSFFSGNGPFRSNSDNMTLSENNYSWNKIANVLYLESSRFIGFSEEILSINEFDFNNNKTVTEVFHALMDFLTVFPEYINRPFFITGHSYASLYILKLSAQIINRIQIEKTNDLNLVGIAIENGMLSKIEQYNSLITILSYKGVIDYEYYLKLMNYYKNSSTTQPEAYFDFSQYVEFPEYGNVIPIANISCGDYLSSVRDYMWENHKFLYESIHYQCNNNQSEMADDKTIILPNFSLSMYARSQNNYNTIDGMRNFYWHKSLAVANYLNQPEVRFALHIPSTISKWIACNPSANLINEQRYNDTTILFQQILNSNYPLNILIYDGDASTSYQFIGDEWFIEKIAKMYSMVTVQERIPWIYHKQIAGYQKIFKMSTKIEISENIEVFKGKLQFVIIKGAGQFISSDRPGQLLQMLNNFLEQNDLSTPIPISVKFKPLKKQYEILEQIVSEIGSSCSDQNLFIDEKLDANKSDDSMPGQTFWYNLKTVTGHLDDGQGNDRFYWWFPSTNQMDPLIIWLGAAPNCTIFYDIFSNIGLYRLNKYGNMLYENSYSWDRVANILFLETIPADIGYYSSNSTIKFYNETTIVNGLLYAIQNFYKTTIGSNFHQNPLYIFGQGYGSYYALLLAQKLINFSEIPKLIGIGLGNSLLDYKTLINIMPNELCYNGLIGKIELDQLIPCCMDENGIYQEFCELIKYITVDNYDNIIPKMNSKCSKLVAKYITEGMLQRRNLSLNAYHSCNDNLIDTDYNGKQIEKNSKDMFASYQCYRNDAISKYFRFKKVQQWLNISNIISENQFCNPSLSYNAYISANMSSLFQQILQQNQQIQILIFDGDSHLQSNFLSNAIFIERFANEMNLTVTKMRNTWTYQKSKKSLNENAGFVKLFKYNPTGATIHLLTVKDAGYHIGLDQPVAALQMIINFLNKNSSNEMDEISLPRQTLLEYQPKKIQQTTQQLADQIFDLPGLTYAINFNQYSGYLRATKGNYLHYWFVESQNTPSIDPLIIWFNGGPGCSSLGGLFIENGPFHLNSDGNTLFENVFSWNKLANILYIESPRQVGFSYQNWSINPSTEFNDTLTTIDAYEAIVDFFKIFANFKTNDLYIAGESYGGIYVSTLTAYIVEKIQKQNVEMNLKGMIIGNGYLSAISDVRSIADFMHFHGIYDKNIWDELQQCCPQRYDDKPTIECQFDDYIDIDSAGNVISNANANATCAELVSNLAFNYFLTSMNDEYNLNQDCYQLFEPVFPVNNNNQQKHLLLSAVSSSGKKLQIKTQLMQSKVNIDTPYIQPRTIYTHSTDSLGGFPCYMYGSTTQYLNQPYVRDALHIPNYIPSYQLCNLNITYDSLYNDTTLLFQQLLNSNYSLNVLLYNGDLDTACNFLQGEWFMENFANSNAMNMNEKNSWLYQLKKQSAPQIGGYIKRFEKNELTIDLATVKGAGHMVPVYRAGPILQLLTNFIRRNEYNDALAFTLDRKPLLPQFMEK